jgi:hypothetical protein
MRPAPGTEYFGAISWGIVPSPKSPTQNQKRTAVMARGDGTVAAVGTSSTSGSTGTASQLFLQN